MANYSLPAVWVVIKATNGSIATRKADVIETSYGQPAVHSHINKVLLFPSLQVASEKWKLINATDKNFKI